MILDMVVGVFLSNPALKVRNVALQKSQLSRLIHLLVEAFFPNLVTFNGLFEIPHVPRHINYKVVQPIEGPRQRPHVIEE